MTDHASQSPPLRLTERGPGGEAHPRAASEKLRARTTVHPAREGDTPALATLVNDAYHAREAWLFGDALRTSERELRENLADPQVRLIVAEVDGEIAGHVRLKLDERSALFGMLAVAAAHQGRGLASLLIGRAEDEGRAAGRAVIRLECARELGLPPYYEALGYRVVGEEHMPAQSRWGTATQAWTRLDMEKAL